MNPIKPRQELLEILEIDLKSFAANGDQQALIVFDLLDFHRINHIYGYQVGDAVLDQIPERLEQNGFRKAICKRMGNDEFVLLLPNLKDHQLLPLAANKLVRTLGEPFRVSNLTLRITPVIGLACCNKETSVAALFATAERNLREAQRQGKNYLLLDTNPSINHDAEYESELHSSIAQNQLALFYQPKLDLSTGLPTHCEALIRWPHPTKGILSPAHFLPILERTGALADVTKWILHTALRQLKEWPSNRLPQYSPPSVAVNIPPELLEAPEFPEVVQSALSIWNVSPKQLTLEITEGALVQEEGHSYKAILGLKELGLNISIDDFGTGYSCLSYFKHLPADELKIDRSFICNMDQDSDSAYLTQLIINLAHRFGMKVVAEGVETEENLHQLKEMGCDYIQGYYISRPLPHNKYCKWLEEFTPLPLY